MSAASPAAWSAWADEQADAFARRLLPGSEDRCGGCGRVLDCCGNCSRCGGRDRTGWQQAGRYEVRVEPQDVAR